MLVLIGLGMETGDISAKATSEITTADYVFAETYTLPVAHEYLLLIEKESGKKITMLKRSEMEEESKTLVSKAIASKIAILVPGDPLIATTHHFLIRTALKMGIECKVYHAPSIFTIAIGASGLDIYKFGPTTTIPFWSEKYKPTSFAEVICNNSKNKQHTLVLLDVDPKTNKTMSALEAITYLKAALTARNLHLPLKQKAFALCEAGTVNQKIVCGEIDSLKFLDKIKTLEGRTCMIIPSEMSFAELELAEAFTF